MRPLHRKTTSVEQERGESLMPAPREVNPNNYQRITYRGIGIAAFTPEPRIKWKRTNNMPTYGVWLTNANGNTCYIVGGLPRHQAETAVNNLKDSVHIEDAWMEED